MSLPLVWLLSYIPGQYDMLSRLKYKSLIFCSQKICCQFWWAMIDKYGFLGEHLLCFSKPQRKWSRPADFTGPHEHDGTTPTLDITFKGNISSNSQYSRHDKLVGTELRRGAAHYCTSCCGRGTGGGWSKTLNKPLISRLKLWWADGCVIHLMMLTTMEIPEVNPVHQAQEEDNPLGEDVTSCNDWTVE